MVLAVVDHPGSRRRVVFRNLKYREVAVLSPVVDLVEERLRVFGVQIVPVLWVLIERLSCLLVQDSVGLLIKV